jgi:tetratricopeptide (TPR) repeat protein
LAINKNKVMDAGRKAYEKGQYDKAIKEYLKIVKEDPKDVRVWLKIGDLYAKKKSKADATTTYMKVAKFYSEQGFYLKAVAVYKQILKVDPRLVEVNLKLAELYRQLGLLSDAMQHFEMVAAFFHREGKTQEALATLRQLVDLDPENVATRIKLAELYSRENMADEAVKEFSVTCDFLRKSGRQDDFIKVAERLIFHKPDNIELCRELATLYLQRNDPRRALAKLQICFKADQSDPNVLGLLAQAFQRLDQKGKTVSVLKELARVHTEAGKRREAREVHEKILEYVPNDPDSLAFLNRKAKPSRLADSVEMDSQPGIPEAPRRFGGNEMGRSTGSMPLIQPPSSASSLGESQVTDTRRSEGNFVAELELDQRSGYDETEHSAVETQASADEIVKILTETDVYVKYGLNQKAIDHLRKVFEIDERNFEARERLQDILIKEGRVSEGLRELLVLAEHSVASNPEQALGYLRQILSHDGSNREAMEFAERHNLELIPGMGTTEESPAAGHLAVAQVDDDFDDLAFSPMDVVGSRDEAAYAGGPKPETVEVDLAQVEEAVSINDMDSDELEFAIAPSTDPLAAQPMPAMDPLAPPGRALSPPPLDPDLEFDPIDAAAFDAHSGHTDLTSEPEQLEQIEDIPELDHDDLEELELDSEDMLVPDSTAEQYLHSQVEEEPEQPFQPPQQHQPPVRGETAARLEDDLDEAEFFLSQGLLAEARDILNDLLQSYPNNPLVLSKIEEVNAAEAGEEPAAPVMGGAMICREPCLMTLMQPVWTMR